MKDKPLVSVYIASKDRASLLKRAIDSVISQSYKNFEIVVVDDGSSDGTPHLLREYRCRYSNIRYVSNRVSIGVAAARNVAVELARGEFITGLDDDDFFKPERIESLVNAYEDKYAFVCSAVVWDWGHRKKIADRKSIVFGLKDQLSYNHATTQILVKRERMLAIGGYDSNMVARIDYDAWTRLIQKFGQAKRISHATYVLNRDDQIERVTSSSKNVVGNHQYLAKHRHNMSRNNLINQEFWIMRAQKLPMSIWQLFRQLSAGYLITKIKYYFRCKLVKINEK